MKKITLKINGKEQTLTEGSVVIVKYKKPFMTERMVNHTTVGWVVGQLGNDLQIHSTIISKQIYDSDFILIPEITSIKELK